VKVEKVEVVKYS